MSPRAKPDPRNRKAAREVAAATDTGGGLEGQPKVALEILDMLGLLAEDWAGRRTINPLPIGSPLTMRDGGKTRKAPG